jgi:hypothetical protein
MGTRSPVAGMIWYRCCAVASHVFLLLLDFEVFLGQNTETFLGYLLN